MTITSHFTIPFLFVLALLLVLSGCTTTSILNTEPATNDVMNNDTSGETINEAMQSDQAEDHIGCQENEISLEGECQPAENNNVSLFERDLSGKITTLDIDEGITGYLAKPVDQDAYPGVIMIHEWWGLNDNIKEMARILASEGYVVLAIDLYDGQVANDSAQAGQLAGSVRNNPAKAVETMKQAVTYLRNNYYVLSVASLGWCFGGGQSLQLALNTPLDATVIYYGQLTDDSAELSKLQGPVLGIFGSEDQSISIDSVKDFENSLNDLNIKNSIHIYDGVGHAFANPTGSNYAPTQTKDAWSKTLTFLEENL